ARNDLSDAQRDGVSLAKKHRGTESGWGLLRYDGAVHDRGVWLVLPLSDGLGRRQDLHFVAGPGVLAGQSKTEEHDQAHFPHHLSPGQMNDARRCGQDNFAGGGAFWTGVRSAIPAFSI